MIQRLKCFKNIKILIEVMTILNKSFKNKNTAVRPVLFFLNKITCTWDTFSREDTSGADVITPM